MSNDNAPPSPANGPTSLDLRDQVQTLTGQLAEAQKANASLVQLVTGIAGGLDNLRVAILKAVG